MFVNSTVIVTHVVTASIRQNTTHAMRWSGSEVSGMCLEHHNCCFCSTDCDSHHHTGPTFPFTVYSVYYVAYHEAVTDVCYVRYTSSKFADCQQTMVQQKPKTLSQAYNVHVHGGCAGQLSGTCGKQTMTTN